MEVLLVVVAVVCFVVLATGLVPRIPWLAVGLIFLALAHMAERLIVEVQ